MNSTSISSIDAIVNIFAGQVLVEKKEKMQILAISNISDGITVEMLEPYFPQDLAAIVRLYLQEKIRAYYFRKDRIGVIFIMESQSVEEAKETLADLPTVQKQLLTFELIPIGPLMPLGLFLK